MSSEWLQLTIGDLVLAGEAIVQTGPFGSQLHSHDYMEDGVPVIPTEAIGRGRILDIDVPRVSTAKARELVRHQLAYGDILFARRGAQATGLSAIVDSRYVGALCGTGALLLRVSSKRVEPSYLSMYLSSTQAFEWLRSHAVGAVMPNLNTDIIKALPITLPSLAEQRELAAFHNALTNRITLLRETNATLEAIAQALFKSWFVDFDPVRAKAEGRQPEGMDAATASLFPDSFEESELGLVPKGWAVGSLGVIAQTARRQIQVSELQADVRYVGLEHIPRKSLSLNSWGNADGLESTKAAFSEGDILFGKLRPYFHKVVLAPFSGVCSTDILVCQPKEREYLGVVAMYLFSETLISYADRLSNGAKMPRVNWKDLAAYPIVVPPSDIAAKLNEAIHPLLARMIEGIHRAETLTQLRDTLLPRLISGQLRLPEAEALIEEAV